MVSKLPESDIQQTKIGGTPMGASNKFNSGSEPETVINGIAPMSKGSKTSGEVSEKTLATKGNVIGGTPMGK